MMMNMNKFIFSRNLLYKINLRTFAIARKDYYQILGVPRDASDDQIKQAYRNLAKKYHPDVNIGKTETYEPSADKFRELSEAYSVLSNKILRLDYDTKSKTQPDIIYNAERYRNIFI
jgi:DnaJ-class molecular chaperone